MKLPIESLIIENKIVRLMLAMKDLHDDRNTDYHLFGKFFKAFYESSLLFVFFIKIPIWSD